MPSKPIHFRGKDYPSKMELCREFGIDYRLFIQRTECYDTLAIYEEMLHRMAGQAVEEKQTMERGGIQ